MNIAAQVDQEVVRLVLVGELDLSTVGLLDEQVKQAVTQQHPERLVIDLAGLSFCDSTGIGALVQARDTAVGGGVAFQVVNPSGLILATMRIVGVHEVLTDLTRP